MTHVIIYTKTNAISKHLYLSTNDLVNITTLRLNEEILKNFLNIY